MAHLSKESIQELITGGESFTLEFKSDRDSISDSDLLEAVICLSNSKGGVLLIGVEDNEAVTGLSQKHLDSSANHLAALISNRTMKSTSCRHF